jgi:hypothetical protein
MADDPVRWIDDPSVSGELRKAMACAAAAPRAPSDTSAALDKLRAKLTEHPTERKGSALGTKAGWIVLGGAFLVGGIAAYPRANPPTRPVAAPTTAVIEPPRSTETTPVPRDPEPEPVFTPTSLAAPAPSARPSSPRAAPVTIRVASPVATLHMDTDASAPPGDESDELARVARARRHLRTDPTEALRLLSDLDRTHPRGIMLEERGVLAIDALVREGRLDEARARARQFLRAYPRSPYTDQITRSTGLSATGADNTGDRKNVPP